MKKVVCFGEIMLSLSPEGYRRFVQAPVLTTSFTGAEANVAVSLSQFGMDARCVSKVPDQEIGQACVNFLRQYGVDTSFVIRGGDRLGVLYLEKGASQRASKVIYDRAHSAIAECKLSDFNVNAILKDADWFHFTGITPALSDNCAALTLKMIKKCKEKGIIVSCDLNYRKKLWTPEKAKKIMSDLLKYVDVLIANEEDAEKVLGISASNNDITGGKLNTDGYIEVSKKIEKEFGIHTIATTLRESHSASRNGWSALLYKDGKAYFSRKYEIDVINRVGGGDSFGAGLIYGFRSGFDPQKTIEFATGASCLKHTIENDFNLVSVDEVMNLIGGDGSGRVQR